MFRLHPLATRRFSALVVLLTMLATSLVHVEAADKLPLAIKGYDPVAYFTMGKALPGTATLEYEWDEQRYRFVNATHLERFKADPARYAPRFGNLCAVALARGEITEANPEYWVISGGQLYLFGKALGPGEFLRDPSGTAAKAEHNLPPKR